MLRDLFRGALQWSGGPTAVRSVVPQRAAVGIPVSTPASPAAASSRPAAAGPRERSFHAYPWWSPRFWHGMPLGVWLDLVAEHRARASLTRWGLMATITTTAVFNSVA